MSGYALRHGEAVAFEEPAAVLDRFAANGIRVGKVQANSGLKFHVPADQAGRRALAGKLELFSRSPYLHQVMAQREDGTLSQYRDLPEALPPLSVVSDRQWLNHSHMPLYARDYGGLSSTQEETRLVHRLLKERKFCRHLELETCTWEILPPAMQRNIVDCLEREYRWTLEALGLEA